ncbi:hypothetical protein J3A64_001778 [Pseudarthrobacter sp. PvP004]|uniref:hypothetical protein n=1 Tax=Pseudarthrobacter sp. PvP004 TaxID=2817850 RepID=UPI001AE4D13B|nr:hypothetical protein [Pseudarthrobacter sp. PvP004]MBP2266314.1 hypothetical protein [Pseudarthrobacter sp. PvP004]
MASKNSEWVGGSGFLALIDHELFLVTTAHIGDRDLAPRADWREWPDRIFVGHTVLVDQEDGLPKRIASFELFFEDSELQRIPRFKYQLREDMPGRMADIILLPLGQEVQLEQTYRFFDLPAEIGDHRPGAPVTLVGRPTSTFPQLVATTGHATVQAGPLRLMFPAGQDGDSGAPVINAQGLLLGMNVGSHVNAMDQAMLLSPEAIVALASSVDGVALEWPQFAAVSPGTP